MHLETGRSVPLAEEASAPTALMGAPQAPGVLLSVCGFWIWMLDAAGLPNRDYVFLADASLLVFILVPFSAL